MDQRFCLIFFRFLRQGDPLLCFFSFFPYVAKTAGFRLRSFSYYAYVNLHAQLSRLTRDCVNFVCRIYDHTYFTMPNALSIFSIVDFK